MWRLLLLALLPASAGCAPLLLSYCGTLANNAANFAAARAAGIHIVMMRQRNERAIAHLLSTHTPPIVDDEDAQRVRELLEDAYRSALPPDDYGLYYLHKCTAEARTQS